MERIPEPELMDDPEQARAYAEADFSEPHQQFVRAFGERFAGPVTGHVLDLGCGPGDISARFARAHPGCVVHGIDAAPAMLDLGRKLLRGTDLEERVQLFCVHLPGEAPPRPAYGTIISNSLLHHLQDPGTLWGSVARFATPGAAVFIMDLMRPGSRAEAEALVRRYAAEEPDVLRRDFFNSLLAAYRPEEVRAQLEAARLAHFRVEEVSDRHLVVFGRASGLLAHGPEAV